MTRGVWFIAAAVVGVAVFVYSGFTNRSDSFETSVAVTTPVVYASTSSIPLRVGGVVEATNDVVVYAQVAGVVTSVVAVEGMSVASGQLVAQQSLPVAEAQLGLTAAQGALSSLQQESATAQATGAYAKSEVQAYTATDVAHIRTSADQNRLAEVSGQLQTTLESGLISTIEIIDFVNQNRNLFTGDALRDFDEIVKDIYGRTPNYFSRGIAYGSKEKSSDLADNIKALRASDEYNIVLAKTYSTTLRNDFDRLLTVYTEAENHVYDRDFSISDDTKTEYEANRNAILATLADLDEIQAAAQVVMDAALANTTADEQSVAVTAIDEEVAATVAKYAEVIGRQTNVVDRAAQAVVAAELSLGQVRVPFAGVVTKVFVDSGDYVTPGTPLMRLSGTDARELAVTAPVTFADSLAIGQGFVVNGETVGYVASFSAVSTNGSVPITISLSDTTIPVGTSVVGRLMVEAHEGLVAVPRQYVSFSTTGSFVRLASGSEESFEIVYDDGVLLYGKTEVSTEEPLVQVTGIHF